MGLREHKRARTRETITRTAYRLFRERGYDATTIEAIAEEAEVSPRTFYRYFGSKDGVLAEVGFEVVGRALERATAPDVAELLRALAASYQELADRNDFAVVSRLLRDEPKLAEHAPLWRQRWGEALAVGLARAEGSSQPTLRHRLPSLVSVHALALAVEVWLLEPGDTTVPDLAEEVLDHLRSSIGDA